MGRFSVIDARVQEILEQFPETRNCDQNLYATYVEMYYYLELNKQVFINYEKYGIPPSSSIERSARAIKEKYPNLKGTSENKNKRKKAEAEYIQHYMKEREVQ